MLACTSCQKRASQNAHSELSISCHQHLKTLNDPFVNHQNAKQDKTRSKKRNAKVVPAILGEKPEVEEERKEDISNKIKIKAKEAIRSSEISMLHMTIQSNKGNSIAECRAANLVPTKQNHSKHVDLQNQSLIG